MTIPFMSTVKIYYISSQEFLHVLRERLPACLSLQVDENGLASGPRHKYIDILPGTMRLSVAQSQAGLLHSGISFFSRFLVPLHGVVFREHRVLVVLTLPANYIYLSFMSSLLCTCAPTSPNPSWLSSMTSTPSETSQVWTVTGKPLSRGLPINHSVALHQWNLPSMVFKPP